MVSLPCGILMIMRISCLLLLLISGTVLGLDKPIYQSTEKEVDAYLGELQQSEPNLQTRIVTLARKNIDQPYELYLLGEAPFETIDAQPIYCLGKSDCVVFVEHTLAMALTGNFPDFVRMLQRIRYKDGQISVLTRNHYTEADWNRNNAWLLRDITAEIAGENVEHYSQTVDRAGFFKKRYQVDADIPKQKIEESYIPFEKIGLVQSQLRSGDVVNFVSGTKGGKWVGHVGLVAVQPDGAVHLIHSTPPKVREETIESYISRLTKDLPEKDAAGKSRFQGFKFLRLTEDPLASLEKIDGGTVPRITLPKDSKVSFDAYLQQSAGTRTP